MKSWKVSLAVVAVWAIAAGLCRAADVSPPAEPMSVWFVKPAASFHESCPLGNGRLGAMDFGGVGRERIVLNESSMWSGGPYDGNNYEAYKCLPEVRDLLFKGDIAAADAVLRKNFRYATGVRGVGNVSHFGTYQILCNLIVNSAGAAEPKAPAADVPAAGGGKRGGGRGRGAAEDTTPAEGYRRDLNLMQGVSHTQYKLNGVNYSRDLLVSKPDEVIVMNLKADKPGSLSFTASLTRDRGATIKADGSIQTLQGQLPYTAPDGSTDQGTRFLALLGAAVKGGKVAAARQRPDHHRRRRSDPRRFGGHELEGQGLRQGRCAAASTRPWPSPSTPFARRPPTITAA